MQSEQPAVEPAGPEADQALARCAAPPVTGDPDDTPRVHFEAPEESAEALKAKVLAIKELIASRVRKDSLQGSSL